MKSEVSNQQLRGEVELLKTSNRRLQVEADAARKDYNLQLQMLANLQDIQVSVTQFTSCDYVYYCTSCSTASPKLEGSRYRPWRIDNVECIHNHRDSCSSIKFLPETSGSMLVFLSKLWLCDLIWCCNRYLMRFLLMRLLVEASLTKLLVCGTKITQNTVCIFIHNPTDQRFLLNNSRMPGFWTR